MVQLFNFSHPTITYALSSIFRPPISLCNRRLSTLKDSISLFISLCSSFKLSSLSDSIFRPTLHIFYIRSLQGGIIYASNWSESKRKWVPIQDFPLGSTPLKLSLSLVGSGPSFSWRTPHLSWGEYPLLNFNLLGISALGPPIILRNLQFFLHPLFWALAPLVTGWRRVGPPWENGPGKSLAKRKVKRDDEALPKMKQHGI